jgi:hypothetical protein
MNCIFQDYLNLVLQIQHFNQLHKVYTDIFQFCALDWSCGHIFASKCFRNFIQFVQSLMLHQIILLPILITCTSPYVIVAWLQLEQDVKNYFPTIKYLNFTIFSNPLTDLLYYLRGSFSLSTVFQALQSGLEQYSCSSFKPFAVSFTPCS